MVAKPSELEMKVLEQQAGDKKKMRKKPDEEEVFEESSTLHSKLCCVSV